MCKHLPLTSGQGKKKGLTYSIKQRGIDLLRRTLDIIILPGQFGGRAGKNTDNVPLSRQFMKSTQPKASLFRQPCRTFAINDGKKCPVGGLGEDLSAAGEPRHRLATFRQQNPENNESALSQRASVDAVILSSGFLRAPGPRLRQLGTLPTANFTWETVQQKVLWNIMELGSTFSKNNNNF